jgi:hypothetical protein
LRHSKPFPPDRYACHHCDNPLCVRPDHIFPGTATENMQDAWAKGRMKAPPRPTHCQRGHEMIGDNVAVEGGKRKCRECRRMRERARRDAAREVA